MCYISEDLTGGEKHKTQKGELQKNSFLPLCPFPAQPHAAHTRQLFTLTPCPP